MVSDKDVIYFSFGVRTVDFWTSDYKTFFRLQTIRLKTIRLQTIRLFSDFRL